MMFGSEKKFFIIEKNHCTRLLYYSNHTKQKLNGCLDFDFVEF